MPSAALRFSTPVQQAKTGIRRSRRRAASRPRRQGAQRVKRGQKKRRKRILYPGKGQLASGSITVGAQNGGVTDVTSGNLQPGTEVVTDTITGQVLTEGRSSRQRNMRAI